MGEFGGFHGFEGVSDGRKTPRRTLITGEIHNELQRHVSVHTNPGAAGITNQRSAGCRGVNGGFGGRVAHLGSRGTYLALIFTS